MGPFAQRSAISIQATCRFGIGTQWVPCSNQNDVTHRDDRLTSRAAASNAPQSSRNPHQDRPNSGRKLGAFPSGCFIDFRALSGHFQGTFRALSQPFFFLFFLSNCFGAVPQWFWPNSQSGFRAVSEWIPDQPSSCSQTVSETFPSGFRAVYEQFRVVSRAILEQSDDDSRHFRAVSEQLSEQFTSNFD